MADRDVYLQIARDLGVPDPVIWGEPGCWYVACQLTDGSTPPLGRFRTPEEARRTMPAGWRRIQATYPDLIPGAAVTFSLLGESDADLTDSLLTALQEANGTIQVDDRLRAAVSATRRHITQLEELVNTIHTVTSTSPINDPFVVRCTICGEPVTRHM